MKTTVALKGMKFYAFHGFYDFERRIGNNFVLDVIADVDLKEDPNDLIDETVNYESLYKICNDIMQQKYKLLESVAFDIASKIKAEFSKVKTVQVRLSKLNPPVGGKVDSSEITITL